MITVQAADCVMRFDDDDIFCRLSKSHQLFSIIFYMALMVNLLFFLLCKGNA